jgi:hypothetical protein
LGWNSFFQTQEEFFWFEVFFSRPGVVSGEARLHLEKLEFTWRSWSSPGEAGVHLEKLETLEFTWRGLNLLKKSVSEVVNLVRLSVVTFKFPTGIISLHKF